MACALLLSGCMSGSLDFVNSVGVDKSVSTNAVPKAPDRVTDEITVRNAVSSADLAKVADSPIPWANASSGSAGVISRIEETREDSTICRNFTTTRHSYTGIANFSGRTCTLGNGDWKLLSFDQQG